MIFAKRAVLIIASTSLTFVLCTKFSKTTDQDIITIREGALYEFEQAFDDLPAFAFWESVFSVMISTICALVRGIECLPSVMIVEDR